MRSDCGRVSGLLVLITARFGRISPRRDGNSEVMALRQFALTLLVLLGSAAAANGKFGAEHLSGFCLDVAFTVWHRLLSRVVMALGFG